MLKKIHTSVQDVNCSSGITCQFSYDATSILPRGDAVGISDESSHITTSKHIIEDFLEPGILSGYRRPNYSLKKCVLSLFQLHNETVNIWTQLIPAAYFLKEFLQMIIFVGDPFLIIYLATTVLFLLTSAGAHTFSCFSPSARHICFFLDYAAITLYACGCAVCYYAYSLPKELVKPSAFVGADVCDVYLFLSIFISIWSTHLSGTTRLWKPTLFRKVIRLSAFVMIWLYLAIPVVWRMFKCVADHNPQVGECSSLYFWKLQFASAITAGSLYVSHFPERWFPGKFDIIGHSHQIFHLFGASGAFNQYRALWIDYTERKQIGHNPSISLCILCISVVMFANLIIFLHFHKKVARYHRHKKH